MFANLNQVSLKKEQLLNIQKLRDMTDKGPPAYEEAISKESGDFKRTDRRNVDHILKYFP